MATWTTIARELCEYLQTTEDKFSLLQRIDSAILETTATVDDVLGLVLRNVQSLLTVPRVSVYVFADGALERLASTDVKAPTAIARPLAIPHQPNYHAIVSRDATKPNIANELDCESVLVAPLFGPEASSLGYLCIESHHPAAVDHLTTPDITDFASAIAKQLSIAIEFKEQAHSDAVRWAIVEEILANDLKPSAGFEIVCANVHRFLPTYAAFRFEPPPACQLLMHNLGDEFLTVVATTGNEPLNTRVLVEKSVCGRLLTDHRDLVLLDPRDDTRYKAYLGIDMRSELALKWAVTPETTVIVNLESPLEGVFKEVHVDALKRARRYLEPILAGLHSRRDRTRLQQRALLYSLDNHLAIVTSSFKHDLLTPLASVRVTADMLAKKHDALPPFAAGYAESLRESVAGIESIRTSLAQDIVGFAHNEARSVCDLLRSAKLLSRPDELAKRKIEIEIACDADVQVYCSLFLKEIFVNLFANAKYWLEQRQQEETGHRGVILARVFTESPGREGGLREAELNQKVVVSVRDNGPGMAAEDLNSVFERSFTRREGGTGFGLFAAKEYVNSLGGAIAVRSEPNEFFEVIITLDVYDSRLYPESEAPAVFDQEPRR